MSSDGGPAQARQPLVGLRPHQDARAIVRLFQCPQCSYPITSPMTLPCGNSLCRRCLPPTFKRENITYPIDARRNEGFQCPFRECGRQHALDDCNIDVTMNKIAHLIRTYMDTYRAQQSSTPLLLNEQLHWPSLVESSIDVMPRSRVLHGGRVVATYVFADMGELDFSSEVSYAPASPRAAETVETLDDAIVNRVREVLRAELECQVCYSLILDPLTTSCGHTFCRKCVARVLDHSNLCPICRRRLPILPGVETEPSNKLLSQIMSALLTEQLAARIAAAEHEEAAGEDDRVPLFPCSLAYPHMPTFLHIFEPRYRLMIRRVMENGSERFGILAYNPFRRPQGSLGNVDFMQFGTMLQIQRVEMFQDGRSLIETKGAYRFRVLDHAVIDGYMVGRIQRVDDIPVAEEEAIEMQETSVPAPIRESPAEAEGRVESEAAQEGEEVDAEVDPQARYDRMSTQELLQYGLDFISAARSRSEQWLHSRVLAAYGQPSTDAATFPYWFASVLPISEEEKYKLLPTTSVRERLKMTARWIDRVEAAQSNHNRATARTVLDSSSDDDDDVEEEESDEVEAQAVPDELENRAGSSNNGPHTHSHQAPSDEAPQSPSAPTSSS